MGWYNAPTLSGTQIVSSECLAYYPLLWVPKTSRLPKILENMNSDYRLWSYPDYSEARKLCAFPPPLNFTQPQLESAKDEREISTSQSILFHWPTFVICSCAALFIEVTLHPIWYDSLIGAKGFLQNRKVCLCIGPLGTVSQSQWDVISAHRVLHPFTIPFTYQ